MTAIVQLDGSSLTLDDLAAVARQGVEVRLADSARDAMQRSHDWVQRAARGELRGGDDQPLAVYGVCLLYTSPSPRDGLLSRMPSSA